MYSVQAMEEQFNQVEMSPKVKVKEELPFVTLISGSYIEGQGHRRCNFS